jgi:hypothetical protein
MRRRSRRGGFRENDHWLIDDITGFKIRGSDARELDGTEKGLYTHYKNWEPTNPQLYITPEPDYENVYPTRLRGQDIFSATTYGGLILTEGGAPMLSETACQLGLEGFYG